MDDDIKKCSSWAEAERAQKAAPEMLKALLLWRYYHRVTDDYDAAMIYAEAMAATDAAVAAATGDNPASPS